MSNRAGTQLKKRSRAPDNSSKVEPATKKVKRNKSTKLEKDCSIVKLKNRKKSSKNEENQPYLKLDSEINIIVPKFLSVIGLSIKIINSDNFKQLRELRIILDRTVVDEYLRNQLLLKKRNRTKRTVRRSKKNVNAKNQGQQTLFQFNFNAAPSEVPPIPNKQVRSLVSPQHETVPFEKEKKIDNIKDERINISVRDLMMLCNVKVNLTRLRYPIKSVELKSENVSSENLNKASSNVTKYDKSEYSSTAGLNDGIARIKIEDDQISQNGSTTTDDIPPIKMEVSDEWWIEKYNPQFSALEMQQMSPMQIDNALSSLKSENMTFCNECAYEPMEEVIQNVPDTLDLKFFNNSNSPDSSKQSYWHFNDDSGVFTSDSSSSFNNNNSFNSLFAGNGAY